MDSKILTLTQELLAGTKNGTFNWESTERKTEFKLRFQHGIISVDKWLATDQDTDETSELVDITFFKPSGEQIERLVIDRGENRKDYDTISALHEVAQRNCLKVDEVLGRLFTEVSSKTRAVQDTGQRGPSGEGTP